MMVAAVVGCGERAWNKTCGRIRRPNDKRVVEHAALFEVEDERGGGLVGLAV